MKRFKIIFSWSLTLAVMILIYIFSSQAADDSTELSGGFISMLYNLFLKITGIPCSTFEFNNNVAELQFVVRKTAHFMIYLTLGFLFSNSYYQSGIKTFGKNILFSLSSSVLYALTDELHQLLVPGRSGELRDVLIDSSGSFCGIALFIFIIFIRRKLWTYQKQ